MLGGFFETLPGVTRFEAALFVGFFAGFAGGLDPAALLALPGARGFAFAIGAHYNTRSAWPSKQRRRGRSRGPEKETAGPARSRAGPAAA
jgi:hypothetical protein